MYTHVVSIGGGYPSTIELSELVIDKYGRENVRLVIAALSGEHPDLWRLVSECEKRTGLEVTRITYQPYRKYLVNAPECMWWDIWDIFNHRKFMGSSLADPCSEELKRKVMRAYIEDTYPKNTTVLHVGITGDEIDRMMAIRARWAKSGYRVEADLCDVKLPGSSAERCQHALGWTPATYRWGKSHNNCGGFCVKAGHGEIARLLWYAPDTYAYHEWQEGRFRERFRTSATIMVDTKTVLGKRVKQPITLEQFRIRMQSRWRNMLPGFDPFVGLDDTPGCAWCDSVA